MIEVKKKKHTKNHGISNFNLAKLKAKKYSEVTDMPLSLLVGHYSYVFITNMRKTLAVFLLMLKKTQFLNCGVSVK